MMVFGLETIRGNIKTVSPLMHGGNEKTGSVRLLNRQRFMTEEGPLEVPIISGNAIRGILRREIFQDMLEQIGYALDVSKQGGQKLYHSFFTGGVLETVDSKSSGVIEIALKKRILEKLIPAQLFGFSIGNQSIESKLKVGQALPICTELKDFLPENVDPKTSFYQLLSNSFQTRKDDLRVEREEDDQAVQMLIEYEIYVPGTVFYHEFKIEDPNILDRSCFARVLKLWGEKPYIGGKSSIGFGEVRFSYDFDVDDKEYIDFLGMHREDIISVIQELENR